MSNKIAPLQVTNDSGFTSRKRQFYRGRLYTILYNKKEKNQSSELIRINTYI